MISPRQRGLSTEIPFPGLRPFGAEDQAFYFGRSDQIYALYRLIYFGFIAVIGSSGSGKSSLVNAGLLPLLEHESGDALGRSWRWAVMTPGDAPIKRLASAVASLGPETEDEVDRTIRRERAEFLLRRSSFGLAEALSQVADLADKSILIVVDQFEELFRYANTATASDLVGKARWRDEASRFVQLLLQLNKQNQNAHVLITMRSDFIGDCAEFQGLPEAVSATQFLTPSLSREQREEAIRGPIKMCGATIDSELVERLLNDLGHEVDQLPVLEHCLLRIWNHACARSNYEALHIDLADYEAVGGMSGALSQHADEVMATLPGLELAVEQVFRALSERDKEGRATRRALPFRRLVEETGIDEADLRKVIDRFRADDCMFLVPSFESVPIIQEDTRIDVIHEALLRRWERMSAPSEKGARGWLDAEDNDGRIYRALLALIDSGATTLPFDQVEMRERWWTSRPRTEAWTDRYGGGRDRVMRLLRDSRAALEAERTEKEQLALRERERLQREAVSAKQRVVQARWFAGILLIIACVAVGLFVWAYRASIEASNQAELAQLGAHRLQAAEADLKSDNRSLKHEEDQKKRDAHRYLLQSIEAQRNARLAQKESKEAAVNALRALNSKAVAEAQGLIAEDERNKALAQQANLQHQNKALTLIDDGNSLSANADYDGAIEDYDRALHYHEFPAAYYQRAIAYRANLRYNSARADLQRVISMEPDNAMAFDALIFLYQGTNSLDRGKTYFTQIIAHSPGNALPFYGRAIMEQGLRDYSAAIADLNTAIELNPAYTKAYVSLLFNYRLLRIPANTQIAEFKTKIRGHTSDDALPYVEIANIYVQSRDYSDAVGYFKLALKAKPKYYVVYNMLGGAYINAYRQALPAPDEKDLSLAIDAFDKAHKYRPDDSTALQQRAIAYELRQDYPHAIEDVSALIASSGATPSIENYYNERAFLYAREGDYSNAVKDMNQVVVENALRPDVAAYRGRGVANFLQGTFDDAHRDFCSAYTLSPADRYSALWLELTRWRSHATACVVPPSQTSGLMMGQWPAPISELFLGSSTVDDVFAAAQISVPLANAHMCEASFFVGEYLLSRGDQNGGSQRLQDALTFCQTPNSQLPALGSDFYDAASAELKRLSASP